jgi:hypothetical protein
MRIQVDDNIAIEVYFNILNREEGSEDDIRLAIHESGPREVRIFRADTTSFLLAPAQAERLARALIQAAQDSRSIPR